MTRLSERRMILGWIDEAVASGARRHAACDCIGLSVRTLQRWRSAAGTIQHDGRSDRVFEPPNKLNPEERAQVLSMANSTEFAHLPPSQIVPILADRGDYIASESTFYRILRDHRQLAHRQASRPKTTRAKPKSLCASGPNQVYSWDITYLPTTVKGRFFYLYLFLDVFSRKIVGWQVYETESSEQAADVLRDLCRRENIPPDQLVLHADNGAPMKGATLLATLQELGVVPSYSRPAVSNDNPYSEALFKTLKYRPEYPVQPFSNLNEARDWISRFVDWYNHQHRHSAIQFVTPAQRHDGLDHTLLKQRRAIYERATRTHPERWSRHTRKWDRVNRVYLNPEKAKTVAGSLPFEEAA
jgi:putative transposase